MSTQANTYTSTRMAKIYFTAFGDTITFSPFLDSFTFETDITVQEKPSSFGKVFKTQKINKHVFNISFNVPSEDWEEALENHRKFGLLIRLNLPDISDQSKVNPIGPGIGVRFSNLIHKLNPNTSLGAKGAQTFIVNKISYAPDLDLGFFDKGGILYAKNFKLTLELILESGYDLLKLDRDLINFSQTDAGKENRKYSPGRLFGFKTPYGEEK